MQTDEDEMQAVSPTESQASSADGVFLAPSHRPSHPFRVIEPDGASVQSILSLGKVGRLLGSVPTDYSIGLYLAFSIIFYVYKCTILNDEHYRKRICFATIRK